ncbi:hypothetical protein PIB30_007503 [Stylosanthes scabra]|uniref:Protein kinase domain-containing protein n=1 Tax=Stylosanthes scabra TaxID=79078 RepID=A0ABU6T5D1_9FABA|nr:hypothetical protein [Stylosanthes scabra]
MPSRGFPASVNRTKSKGVFLALSISACAVILCSLIYFLYHLWQSVVHRGAKTIPFEASAPLKLQRFSYKDLKLASNGFDSCNIIGKGGSGTVFRGILKDGKLIAIKRLDSMSVQAEREFQNELQVLGGLRSPFLVALLGYCAERDKRVLVYEYMPNRSLQESLFGDVSMPWDRRFSIILDVARALEFLHVGCDPPVIHGDVKPSNVLLDADCRAKISDFGLSRIKLDPPDFPVDLFSHSQDLSGNLTADTHTHTPTRTHTQSVDEVDFAIALQASSSSKNTITRPCFNVRPLNLSEGEITLARVNANLGAEDDEFSSLDYSKDLTGLHSSLVDDDKAWGKDWWWKQDGSGELCSRDYVTEWIGSQICPSNSDWVGHKPDLERSGPMDKASDADGPQLQQIFGMESTLERKKKKKPRKMREWWKEEHIAELSKLKSLQAKWKKGLKVPHFDLGRRFYFCRRKKLGEEGGEKECDQNGEFSFRRGWKKKKSSRSIGSEMWSGDLFSRELSSTTSMRGTLCYVAPEYGGCGFLMEKADIYSFGVLILVIVSGRRPLHVLASPMKLEKANLISWCRQLAQAGNILELVDERLKQDYNKDQAGLCINLALACLQRIPELRPDIGDIVKILKGEMDLPPLPFEFSPSPPSKLYSRSRRKHKGNVE